jgi:GT2 family glycosyltransferase
VLQSLAASATVVKWVVVDNGARDFPAEAVRLRALTKEHGGTYLDPGGNHGFGAGHNAALGALRSTASTFHLMLNPDIVFAPDAIGSLEAVMDANADVALLMPSVRYPDQSTQYLCKLLPMPLDFALRRFAPGPLRAMARRRMDEYELRQMDLGRAAEVPFLSGCFMFTRRAALEAVGGFDERYFLYMEDVDLCRRLAEHGKLLYWPEVVVTHRHERGSHHSLKLTLTHMRSAVRYYNRWGWIFDSKGRQINQAALQRLLTKTQAGSSE